jgi:hypothetical protein
MPVDPDREDRERRSEPRLPAAGQVNLRPEGWRGATASGRLADRSERGFRAEHGLKALATGQIVHFEYGTVEGRARVIWTRITGDRVESGFLVLPERCEEA